MYTDLSCLSDQDQSGGGFRLIGGHIVFRKNVAGGDLKLAQVLNKSCLSASAEADLEPGDKTKVDTFCMRLHKKQALKASHIISCRQNVHGQQSSTEDQHPEIPAASSCSRSE